MQLKLKILTGLIAAPLSFNTFAGLENLTGAFKTIKDVSITGVPGSDIIMEGLHLPNSSSCNFLITPQGISAGNSYPGDIVMKIGGDTGLDAQQNAPGGTVGATSGVGCVDNSNGLYGLYLIDGSPGASVKVTITDPSTGSVIFKAAGCAANYNDGNNGDECLPVSQVQTTQTIRLAGPNDLITNASSTPVEGQSLVVLGGEAVAAAQLTPGFEYTVPFDITVAY
jgi:hypothetical protein